MPRAMSLVLESEGQTLWGFQLAAHDLPHTSWAGHAMQPLSPPPAPSASRSPVQEDLVEQSTMCRLGHERRRGVLPHPI